MRGGNGQTQPSLAEPEFINEPPADFAINAARQKMDLALQEVQKQFGKHYALVINGKSVAADKEFSSVNPARPNRDCRIYRRRQFGECHGGRGRGSRCLFALEPNFV